MIARHVVIVRLEGHFASGVAEPRGISMISHAASGADIHDDRIRGAEVREQIHTSVGRAPGRAVLRAPTRSQRVVPSDAEAPWAGDENAFVMASSTTLARPWAT